MIDRNAPVPSYYELPRWYATYTKPHHERRVADLLHFRNVELFYPVWRQQRCWSNGCRVTLESPLFPNYVFVRMRASERVRVLELSGVLSIIGTSQGPTALPDEQIEQLRSGLQFVTAEPHPVLTVGEKVRICRGPLEGLSGVVSRVKNRYRVVLTLELVMRSVAVEVSVDDVEPMLALRAMAG
jgi:transcription antitermination factor NusG